MTWALHLGLSYGTTQVNPPDTKRAPTPVVNRHRG